MFYELPNCPFEQWLISRSTTPTFTLTEALPGQPNYSTIYGYRLRDAKLQHPGYHPRKARQHHS